MGDICFLIAAHKNYNQTVRLINHLRKDFDLYVHIDKKSELNINGCGNVGVYKKYKVYHGGFSQIKATLFLMAEASKNNYDRYVFISAQDIPLKSNFEIKKFFDDNGDKEFLSYENIRNGEELYREMSFRLNAYNFGFWYRKLLSRKIREIASSFPPIKRETPEDIYYGSQWWNLTNKTVYYILNYAKENPNYLNRFKYTWGSDEFFFQSVVMQSEFKDNCENNCLRRIIWKGGVPMTFKLEDYDRIKATSDGGLCLFARKFDENADNDIIDKLYKDLTG